MVVAACGSVAPSPSVEEVCAHIYDAAASRGQRCGDDDSLGRVDFLDICRLLLASPGFEGSTPAWDACATEWKDASCDDPPRCWPHGTLRGGAACGSHAQCLGGYCSTGSVPKDLTCGVCEPAVGLGESCGDPKPAPGCGSGLWCDATKHCAKSVSHTLGESCDRAAGTFCRKGQCVNGVCTPPAGLGGACAEVGCVAAYGCVNGVCTEPPGEGEACSTHFCAAHLYCSQSKVCVRMTQRAHGEACGGPEIECVAGQYCNGGICTGSGPVPRGGACVTTNDCKLPFACTGGTCQPWDPGTCR